MQKLLILLATILFVLVVMFFFVGIDFYRWHMFQETTGSDMGFFKWNFLFNQKR